MARGVRLPGSSAPSFKFGRQRPNTEEWRYAVVGGLSLGHLGISTTQGLQRPFPRKRSHLPFDLAGKVSVPSPDRLRLGGFAMVTAVHSWNT